MEHKTISINEKTALIIITLLGALLRFYTLGGKSFWFDEVHSIHLEINAHSISDVWSLLTKYFISDPPLFHMIQYMLLGGSHSEWWARLVPSLAAILSIPAFFFLSKIFFDKKTSFISTIFFVISPFHIYYSQENRPYSIFLLFSILSFIFLFLAIRGNNRLPYWLGYTIFTSLCTFTHYLSFFMIICHAGLVTICFLPFNNSIISDDLHISKRQTLKSFISSVFIVSLIFYILWYPSMKIQRNMTNVLNITSPPLSLKVLSTIINDLTGIHYYIIPFYTILLTGFSLLFMKKEKKKCLPIFLWWILFPIISEYIFLTGNKTFFNPRHVIYIFPSLILLLGFSITSFIELKNYLPILITPFLYIILAIAVLLPHYYQLNYYYITDKMPWKEVVRYLNKNASDNDILTVEPKYYLPDILFYFGEKDFLLHQTVVRNINNQNLYFGHLLALDNIEELIKIRGMWCITNPQFSHECSNRGFKLIRKFDSILSPVLIYGNSIAAKRLL